MHPRTRKCKFEKRDHEDEENGLLRKFSHLFFMHVSFSIYEAMYNVFRAVGLLILA